MLMCPQRSHQGDCKELAKLEFSPACLCSFCRVVPLHSLKLISELQHQLATKNPTDSKQRNPLMIRVEVRAGHGAGKPTAKIIAETSDLIGFAAQCVGATWAGGASIASL